MSKKAKNIMKKPQNISYGDTGTPDNMPGITSRIMAVTMNGKQPYKGYAAFNGEQLIITEITPIRGFFGKWKGRVIEEIKARTAEDFVVVVEETTDLIARHATQHFDFEDREADGKINLYRAFDMYFSMKSVGNLVLTERLKKFDIRDHKVDVLQDDKGRKKYNVNWPEFTGENRIILLCVMAAQYEPISDKYLKEFFDELGIYEQKKEDDPVAGFLRMMEMITKEGLL